MDKNIYFQILASFHWDPNPEIFVIPWINWPIRWYGLFFAIGFVLSYMVFQFLLQRLVVTTPSLRESHVENWNLFIEQLRIPQSKELLSFFPSSIRDWIANYQKGYAIPAKTKMAIIEGINSAIRSNECWTRKRIDEMFSTSLFTPKTISRRLCDTLTWYVVIATIVGARLGHILFYELDHYIQHPEKILKTWEGGLASHGGAVALSIALFIFYRRHRYDFPEVSFLVLFDLFSIIAPFAGFWIRIGNFINQEIVGTSTSLPWGVVFGHPYEGVAGIPYHPVQLYEAMAYLVTFVILLRVWVLSPKMGRVSGLMFILVFSSRFFLEFFKQPQGGFPGYFPLQMGQILSIPCILVGFSLLFQSFGVYRNTLKNWFLTVSDSH